MNRENETSEKKSSSRRVIFVSAVFLLILVLGAVIYLWSFLQKPVSSVAHIVETPEAKKEPVAFERFEGKFFSFRYAGTYDVKNHKEAPSAGGDILENALLLDASVNSKKIALTVESLQGRKMEDSANYNLRKAYPKKYRQEKFSAGEISGIAFTEIDSGIFGKVIFIQHFANNSEKENEALANDSANKNNSKRNQSAGFIPHENYLAEISLSGPLLSDGTMEKEFADIIESIQWKK